MLCDNALIVFAKHPVPGQVKTRLTPHLTPEEAAALYRCMLLDTLEKVRLVPALHRHLFYQGDPSALQYFQQIAPDFALSCQSGCDLGQRMAAAFRNVISLGCQRVIIVGTDTPDLPVDYLHRAFDALTEGSVDVVFGPSVDGGYYLLGLKSVPMVLFEGIPWSTGAVLTESMARADMAGIRTHLLPEWYDVDTAADLRRKGLLQEDNGAPQTRQFVERLVFRC